MIFSPQIVLNLYLTGISLIISKLPFLKMKSNLSLYTSVLAFIENIISFEGRTLQILSFVHTLLVYYSYTPNFVGKNSTASVNYSSSFF